MSSPLAFYRTFKALMTDHGIRHVLTSDMACVEYGIQQNTKETDWIIDPRDLPKLVRMLVDEEPGLTGKSWWVSYRPLFGAPLTIGVSGGWQDISSCHSRCTGFPGTSLRFFRPTATNLRGGRFSRSRLGHPVKAGGGTNEEDGP